MKKVHNAKISTRKSIRKPRNHIFEKEEIEKEKKKRNPKPPSFLALCPSFLPWGRLFSVKTTFLSDIQPGQPVQTRIHRIGARPEDVLFSLSIV